MTKKIGVLALQGAVTEHLQALNKLDITASAVKLPADLDGLDGLIIPGGESTAIGSTDGFQREPWKSRPRLLRFCAAPAIFAPLCACTTSYSSGF